MTSRPTDDELKRLGDNARETAKGGYDHARAAERRALYEAGEKAGAEYEAKRCGHADVAWLLTDEARYFVMDVGATWTEAGKVLKHLHDRITGGGQ
jgi:hypothetical protein